jgi:hypothetical protein
MEKFKNYTIISLMAIIAVLILLRQCGDGGTKNETIIKGASVSDTLTVHDTIRSVDTIIHTKWLKSPRITSETPISVINDSVCKMYRTYTDSTEDENQTLYYTAKVLGRLDSIRMDYKLKIPLIINNTITINTLRVDTIVKPNKWSLYGYSEVGGNSTQFNTSLGIDLAVRRVIVGYRYEAIQKTHNVKIGIRILKSKK